jgi:hypothetical protein
MRLPVVVDFELSAQIRLLTKTQIFGRNFRIDGAALGTRPRGVNIWKELFGKLGIGRFLGNPGFDAGQMIHRVAVVALPNGSLPRNLFQADDAVIHKLFFLHIAALTLHHLLAADLTNLGKEKRKKKREKKDRENVWLFTVAPVPIPHSPH